MTTPTLSAEPVCPGAVSGSQRTATASTPILDHPLAAFRRPFDSIPRRPGMRSRRAIRTPPRSRSWAFQRAWWDAYGANAHDETLVDPAGRSDGRRPRRRRAGRDRAADAPPRGRTDRRSRSHPDAVLGRGRDDARAGRRDGDLLRGLVPRRLRHGPDRAGRPRARGRCRGGPPRRLRTAPAWDVVDLRRLRCGDPAAEALAAAFGRREAAGGWTLNLEREDVCPVVTLPGGRRLRGLPGDPGQEGAPRDPAQAAPGRGRRADQPDSLGRPAGRPAARSSSSTRSAGARTACSRDTPGGAMSRRFFRRLFELLGPDGPLVLSFLAVGAAPDRGGHPPESTARRCSTTTRAIDPDARDLSPGRPDGRQLRPGGARRAGRGGWTSCAATSRTSTSGAPVDEPIQRLLVRRSVGR